jgi:hypothetical protein
MRSAHRVLSAIAGVICALAIAEGSASAVHHGAFPYLNAFVADTAYGVRLAPGAEARVRSRLGRVTTVRTNAEGFRGPEWRGREDVLVLGDSQAFGLHVEWEDTFAARLSFAARLGAADAAVPTWGPREHLAILDELAPRLRPRRVVLLLNVANDWHEAGVANALRTTARDGWAVRPHATGTEASSGGALASLRSLLVRRSHLVYAARQVAGFAASEAPLRSDAPHRLVEDLPWLARPSEPGFASRLGPTVRDARDACARHGCELLVVVLPLDVQVHAREWAKYRERPIDLRATEVLAADLVRDAVSLGVTAIDLLPALRGASPGAFLPDDPHLSPAGHAAVAAAIERAWADSTLEARR